MLLGKIGWTLWALLPVAGLAYHFGPGQRAYTEDRAADIIEQARRLDVAAQGAQDAAYQLHLASLGLRRNALASKAPEDEAAARAAAIKEDEAYRVAGEAWKTTADKLQQAQDMLASCNSEKTSSIRVAKDRALVRAGRIGEGVGDLETLLESLAEAGQQESPLAAKAREEVATGYYYGARLMRAAGKPTPEWRAISGSARQNFRYLAETGASVNSNTADLQKNLELVLNLEQSAQEDLMAKPLPKNSPRAGAEGLGKIPRTGKSKRPPRKGPDARGASGVGDIDSGW